MKKSESWRRIVLLIVAITVHNIPGVWGSIKLALLCTCIHLISVLLQLSDITSNVLLCILATLNTICFITEGLAVGVGFGAIGKSPSATFESARYKVIHTVHI